MKTRTQFLNEERMARFRSIAQETLGIKSLEPAGKPSTDFHVVSVENLARALDAAYRAGVSRACRERHRAADKVS